MMLFTTGGLECFTNSDHLLNYVPLLNKSVFVVLSSGLRLKLHLQNSLQALDGFDFSTVHELSNREQISAEPKKLGRVGIQTQGRWVRRANATSFAMRPPPNF